MINDASLQPIEGVRIWIEQGSSIHLKAVDRFGDPVELSEQEADAVIVAMQSLLARLRSGGSK